MAVVRKRKEHIDVLEHTMRGVRTTENSRRIVSFDSSPGLIGTRSSVVINMEGLDSEEREVTVMMPKMGSRRRPR
jgi:hypothetical protein